jgi:hypothetical protein
MYIFVALYVKYLLEIKGLVYFWAGIPKYSWKWFLDHYRIRKSTSMLNKCILSHASKPGYLIHLLQIQYHCRLSYKWILRRCRCVENFWYLRYFFSLFLQSHVLLWLISISLHHLQHYQEKRIVSSPRAWYKEVVLLSVKRNIVLLLTSPNRQHEWEDGAHWIRVCSMKL